MSVISKKKEPYISKEEKITRRAGQVLRQRRFPLTRCCAAFFLCAATALGIPAAACAQAEEKPAVAEQPVVASAETAAATESSTWDAVLSQGIRPDKPKVFTRFSVEQLVRTMLFGAAADYARLPLLNYRLGGESAHRMSVNMSVSRRDTSTLGLSYRF